MGGCMKRFCAGMALCIPLLIGHAALAQTLVDPMRPPVLPSTGSMPSPVAAPPAVHTIIIGPGRRYATVDGRTITEGDTVRGMRVTRIDEARVMLRDTTGQNVALELHPAASRNTSTTAQSERNAISVRVSKP
jgi:hypothetical protein